MTSALLNIKSFFVTGTPKKTFGSGWAGSGTNTNETDGVQLKENQILASPKKLRKFARKKFIHLSAILSKAMNLGIFINDLLFEHNCVVVPDLGGFITRRTPALINPVSHKITPPGKKIAFNQGLKLDDGLLAQQIAIQNNISYEAALKVIGEQVVALKNQLYEIRTVHLDKVGSFYLDADETLSFHPETDLNFATSSYGLPTLSAHVIQRDEKEKLKKKVKREIDYRAPLPIKRVKPERNQIPLLKYLGNSVLLAFVGLLVFFSVSIDTSIQPESLDLVSMFKWSDHVVVDGTKVPEKLPHELISRIKNVQEGASDGFTYDVLVIGIRDTEKAHELIAGYRKQGLEKARIGLMEHDSTFISIGRYLNKTQADEALAIAKKHWGTALLLTLKAR